MLERKPKLGKGFSLPKKLEKKIEKRAEELRIRGEKAKRLRKRGGSIFRIFQIKFTNEKTDKLEEDIVISAIIEIENLKNARSFYLGYIKDIRNYPEKYPKKAAKNPREYARADIMLALSLHFTSPKTHKLWTKAVGGEKADFSYTL